MSPNQRKGNRFFAMVYPRYDERLHRYLSRRLDNEQDARELAQEVWMRLLRVRDTTEVLEPLAYIYRTASNVLIEFHMRRRREQASLASVFHEGAVQQGLQGTQDDETIDVVNRQSALEETLARLPRTYRDILILKLTRELSYRQIGAELGFSPKTVEQYFFRAMALVKSRRTAKRG